MIEKLKSEKGQETYNLRMHAVEPFWKLYNNITDFDGSILVVLILPTIMLMAACVVNLKN